MIRTCFCYLSWQIDFGQLLSADPLLDFRWAAFATQVGVLQIPLLGCMGREGGPRFVRAQK